MTTVKSILLFVSLVLLPKMGAAETNVLSAKYLDDIRTAIRTEHPSVAAADARLKAAEVAIRGVRLWEDPMVGLGVMGAESTRRRDDGDLMFSIEQTLPRRKLFEAERDRARAERSVAAADLQSTAVRLETTAVQTAIELSLADEMVAINTNQVQWLERMAVNARERLKDPAAMSGVSEALRVESELAQEKQRLDSNTLMRRRLERQLNILLGRPTDEIQPAVFLPRAGISTPALDDELAKLLDSNPTLQSLMGAAQVARSDIEIAKRQSKPVFSVGVDSRVYSEGGFRESTVGAKMTIPLFNRSLYKANVERAKSRQDAAEKEVEALERELRSQLVVAFTDAENAARQSGTFSKEVIPRAEKAAESTQNAWISSKATLLEVLEARRAALNARLEERRFVASRQAALETLRSIVPPKTQR